MATDVLSGGVMKTDKCNQAAILDMMRYGDIKPADTIKHRIRITSNDLGHQRHTGKTAVNLRCPLIYESKYVSMEKENCPSPCAGSGAPQVQKASTNRFSASLQNLRSGQDQLAERFKV